MTKFLLISFLFLQKKTPTNPSLNGIMEKTDRPLSGGEWKCMKEVSFHPFVLASDLGVRVTLRWGGRAVPVVGDRWVQLFYSHLRTGPKGGFSILELANVSIT